MPKEGSGRWGRWRRFPEDDIALENGFTVSDDVGDGHAAVKALADLLGSGRCVAA